LSAAAGYALIWVGFAAYLAILVKAPSLSRRLVWGAIAVSVAVFAALPPLLSNDVYSYVDYARLGVLHGLDPYVHPPLAEPADPAFAEVDWTESTSVYGPLFTLLSYPLAALAVDAAVWTLKLLAAAAVLTLCGLVARLAALRGVDPLRAAAFVGLNPLVLVHVVGGAHNDGLAIVFAVAGCAAVLALRPASGGALLVASAAVKVSAAFAGPFALLGAGRNGTMGRKYPYMEGFRPIGGMTRFAVGALTAAAAIAAVSYAAFGWDWLGAIGLAGENQSRTSHMSVPITAARLLGLDADPIQIVALALYGVLMAYLLAWTWRGGDWIRAAGWAGLGLLLATSWLLPWYLIWVAPFAAISRDRPLLLLTLALTAFQLTTRIPI
jgi:alpha-1,6-mannosyltransferase